MKKLPLHHGESTPLLIFALQLTDKLFGARALIEGEGSNGGLAQNLIDQVLLRLKKLKDVMVDGLAVLLGFPGPLGNQVVTDDVLVGAPDADRAAKNLNVVTP